MHVLISKGPNPLMFVPSEFFTMCTLAVVANLGVCAQDAVGKGEVVEIPKGAFRYHPWRLEEEDTPTFL